MVPAGIDDAQLIAAPLQVKVHPANLGRLQVFKIDGDKVAHRRGHLIEQAAGLAKVDVFGILRNLRRLHRGELARIKQPAEDGADQNLKGRRGGKAGSTQHIRGGIGVKAADLVAQLGEPGSDAPDERAGPSLLLRPRLQLVDPYLIPRVALRLDADDPVIIRGGNADHIQIDARREHPPALMVGVVAADLRAPGGGKDAVIPSLPEELLEAADGLGIARALLADTGLAIKPGKGAVKGARGDLSGKILLLIHRYPSIKNIVRLPRPARQPPQNGGQGNYQNPYITILPHLSRRCNRKLVCNYGFLLQNKEKL